MNKRITMVLLILGLAMSFSAPLQADEAESLTRLDQALKAVSTYEYGKDSAPLTLAEQLVVEAAKSPAQRAVVEERLIRSLGAAATRDGKEFLCRQLFTIGTERSVPALEALLTDPELSHIARFALGRNESPAAGQALQRALGKTSGPIQVGIINTLGLRRFEPAIPDLKPLLGSRDAEVAQAAAAALGAIGSADAVKALQAVRAKAPEAVQRHIDNGLLTSADRFLATGNPADAAKIYEAMYVPTQTLNFRIAALRGLAAARPEKALPQILEAIRGADPKLRAAAISFSAGATGTEATRALAGLLPALAPDGQQLLLGALGTRGDSTAMPAVLACVQSGDPAVRTAACTALGTLGDTSAVTVLLRVAANTTGGEQVAARASLVQLKRGDIEGTLIRACAGDEPKVAVEAVRALASRRATVAFKELLKLATGREATVRREAIRALGILAEARSLPDLIAVIPQLQETEDLSSVEDAVAVALPRLGQPVEQAAPLLVALERAPVAARPVLLRLLGVTGAPGALTALRTAIKDSNATVAEAAVRALAEWPDAAPADDLLELVQSTTVPATKVIALRGYVRMAALGKNPGAMYARALKLAERPEDKKLVLSSLGTADPGQAFQLVEPYLKDEGLKSEAALALVQIADRLRQTDTGRAKAVLKQVLAIAPEPPIRQRAQEVLNEAEALDGHILDWVGAGPYSEKDKEWRALFDVVFPPEQPNAEVKWVKLTKGLGTWDVNLGDALGGGDNVVGYVRTGVWSAAAREARLELGSDDGIKAWLNGKVVHANNTDRGLTARQDIAKIALREGWNELLLKVTNAGGGWAFSCRIRQPDGSELEGLKFEAK